MARPWETLASVATAEGTLDLRRRGDKDYLITIAGRVLMSSSEHRSEDALAKLACAGLRGQRRARVLVSGLGMGYTLRTALDELAEDAEVTVAELNGVVVEWCKGPLGALTKSAALDPRVSVVVKDVTAVIGGIARDAGGEKLHAIILDMYEGPQTRLNSNDPLYGSAAVMRVKHALVPGGIFAVWCEGPSPSFERSLTEAGFRYERQRVGRGGRVHSVYLAKIGGR